MDSVRQQPSVAASDAREDTSKILSWRMRPGDTLADRIRPDVEIRWLCFQWALLTVAFAAGVSGSAVLAVAGTAVFCLLAYGIGLRIESSSHVFGQVPRIAADEPADGHAPLPGVTVISPARNEETIIERAARSLAGLDYPNLEVIVVDDHSTDNTGAILDRIGAECPRLRVIHNPTPTDGWQGKPNAVWRAVHQMDEGNEWILFTDADVVFHPLALRQLVAYAESQQVDFLTCLPYLECGNIWEELLLPVMWKELITAAPPSLLNHPDSIPVGIGAFLLVRREVYFRSGGHSVYPHLHSDDTMLAGVVKEVGGKVAAVWTPDLLRIRLYHGWAHLRAASVRKMRAACEDDLAYPAACLSLRALPATLPVPMAALAVWHQISALHFSLALSAYAVAALWAYWMVVKSYDGVDLVSDTRKWTRWVHPIGGVARIFIAAEAIVQILRGRSISWRGREEPAHSK